MRKSLGNNLIWNSIGTTFYFGCQWLLTVLVVYFNGGYSDAGVLSLAMSISGPLLLVANLNLRVFQVSEMEGRFSEGDFLVNRMFMSGVAVVFCICFVLYKEYGSYEKLCIIVFMVYKISEALADVLHGIDQRAWRLDIAGKSYVLRGIAILASIGCGMLLGGNLILTILLITVLSYLVVFFYDFCKCRKSFQLDLSYKRENVVSLLKIGVPLAVYSILLNLIAIFPRFQIEEQYGKELLGIFASITTPTVLISQLASFVFSPLMGTFAESRKEHDAKRLHKLLLVCIAAVAIIGVVAVAAGSLLGEWALVLLFGETIRAYAYLLIPIIFTAILTAVIWLLCGLLTVFEDYYMLAILTFISLLPCLVFAPALIVEKQLIGAVLVWILALLFETFLLGIRLIFLLRREELLYRKNFVRRY